MLAGWRLHCCASCCGWNYEVVEKRSVGERGPNGDRGTGDEVSVRQWEGRRDAWRDELQWLKASLEYTFGLRKPKSGKMKRS